MLGMLLGALGSAATSAGMGTLGAGLTAAGATLGKIPGMGGGLPGVGPGSAPPSAMPFGFDITKLANPASPNLGTQGGGNAVSSFMDKDKQNMQQLMAQSAQAGASQPVDPRRPVDISQLMAAINSRGTLGT